MSARLRVWVFVCLAWVGCVRRGEGVQRPYANSDLTLVTSYTAKDFCSCVFVEGMDEDYCRRWTAARPAVTSASVDSENKRVKTRALLFWSQKARYVSERDGCVLE